MPRSTTPSSSARARLAIAACLALAWLHVAPAARAQSAGDIESARTLYREGLELRAKGDLRASLERLKAAHTLVPTPITALELGRGYEALRMPLEAREILLSVARLPKRADESTKGAAARDQAAALAEQLKPRIASARLHVASDGGAPPQVRLDGAPLAPEALLVARAVDPGHHVVVASANGREATTEFDTPEGQTVDVTVKLPPALPAPPPAASPAESPSPSPSSSLDTTAGQEPRRGLGPVTWIGIGVAAAGVVVGSVTGAITLSKASALKQGCGGGACPPGLHDDLDTAETLGNVSTVAFAVAGAGALVAVIGLLTRGPAMSEPRPQAHTSSWAAPCSVGGLTGFCGHF